MDGKAGTGPPARRLNATGMTAKAIQTAATTMIGLGGGVEVTTTSAKTGIVIEIITIVTVTATAMIMALRAARGRIGSRCVIHGHRLPDVIEILDVMTGIAMNGGGIENKQQNRITVKSGYGQVDVPGFRYTICNILHYILSLCFLLAEYMS